MIRFAHIEYLYALALLPVLVVLFLWVLRLRKRALQSFGNPSMLHRLMPMESGSKRTIKFLLLVSAIAFLTLGIANPQIGTKMEEVKRAGVDIMIALDVSNSMKAEDIKPNRLENAKQEISHMLDKLQSDRIGIIVFGGDSYLQLPLTADYSAAWLILSTVDVDVVPVPGTAIGSAIRLAMKSFVAGEQKHKVIILITDGENHEDDAIAAAKEAHEDGTIIHTIGMGSPDGAPIPIYQNNIQVGYRKDADGNVVVTKLDEQSLLQIAEAGGGKFIRATNQQSELDAVLKEIESMEKKEFGAKVFTEYEDRFQYFLAAALLLIVAEFYISERKNRFLMKWTIFKESP
ncbi:MAG: VWA domain-containing protein [Ignavibacteriae bacterium]|nr:VWA domain-containing protein [Ignavibacteria bacterium]MBI3364361.1 VWA domain-containing protein [Ignavibacteriota bacterium]